MLFPFILCQISIEIAKYNNIDQYYYMTDVLEKTGMINGPTNIVRMEGSFAGINKIIYLFMDYHIPVNRETRCPSYTSLDIYQYFAVNLESTKHTIDFMFEENLSYTTKPDDLHRKRYIDEVSNYFNSKFNDGLIKKKKKEKTNVRFHYVDVRDNMGHDIYRSLYIIQNMVDAIQNTPLNFTNEFVTSIKKNVTYTIEKLNLWSGLLFGNLDFNIKQYQKIVSKQNNVPKIIKKMREGYKHKKVLKNMKGIFDHVHNLFGNLIDKLNELVNTIDKHVYMIDIIQNGKLHFSKLYDTYFYGIPFVEYLDFSGDLIKKLDVISGKNIVLFANIMDIFFLRRFLDKDYIDHAIVYTGAAHSLNYVQHLITKYDFKITHVSYSLERNMKKLNAHLKKHDDPSDRKEYEKNLYSPVLFQCSSIAYFPKDFE